MAAAAHTSASGNTRESRAWLSPVEERARDGDASQTHRSLATSRRLSPVSEIHALVARSLSLSLFSAYENPLAASALRCAPHCAAKPPSASSGLDANGGARAMAASALQQVTGLGSCMPPCCQGSSACRQPCRATSLFVPCSLYRRPNVPAATMPSQADSLHIAPTMRHPHLSTFGFHRTPAAHRRRCGWFRLLPIPRTGSARHARPKPPCFSPRRTTFEDSSACTRYATFHRGRRRPACGHRHSSCHSERHEAPSSC